MKQKILYIGGEKTTSTVTLILKTIRYNLG